MKNHSYMAVNGAMADNYHRMRRIETHLEERVEELYGAASSSALDMDNSKHSKASKVKGAPKVSEAAWEVAVAQARAAAYANGATQDSADAAPSESSSTGTSAAWASLTAQRGTSELRQRTTASTTQRRASIRRESRNDKESEKESKKSDEHDVHDPHPLVAHPDQLVSVLAREIEDIREDLRSTGPNEAGAYVSWPQNVTYLNFFDYLCCPVLVYELTYPRVKT